MRKSLLTVVIAGILLISYVATGSAVVGPEMFIVIGLMLTPFIIAGGIVYLVIKGLRS